MSESEPRNRFWDEAQTTFLIKCVKEDKIHPEDIAPLWKAKFGFNRTEVSLMKECAKQGVSIAGTAPKRKQVRTKVAIKEAVHADVAEHKLKQKLSEVQSKYKLLMKGEGLGDRMVKALKEDVKALPTVQFKFTPPKGTVTVEEAGLMLGDFHLGEEVTREGTYGFGEYDFPIFVRRLKFLENKIKDIVTDQLRGYKFTKLHIFGMGDMVSGMIHDELVENAESIIFQVLNGAFVTAQFILNLQQLFPKVEIDGVLGNHGRLHQKKRYKRHYENWDYVFYQYVGMFLAINPQIKWRWAKSPFLTKKIYDWEFLVLHGDNIQSWMGIPWYGIERAMWKLGDLIQSKEHRINYRLLGHFHNSGEMDRVTGEMLINGSMIGGNEFSLGKMFTFGRPTQVFFGVNKRIGITWRFPLRLDLPEVDEVKPYPYSQNFDAGLYLRDLIKKKE